MPTAQTMTVFISGVDANDIDNGRKQQRNWCPQSAAILTWHRWTNGQGQNELAKSKKIYDGQCFACAIMGKGRSGLHKAH